LTTAPGTSTRTLQDSGPEADFALPFAFWLVWAGTFVNRMGSFVLPMLVPFLTQGRGMSKPQAAALFVVYGVGVLGSQVVGGVLADRLGRKAPMLIGLSATSVALLFLPVTHQYTLLGAEIFLVGFSGDMHRPGVNALVTDLVPARVRVRGFAYLSWASNLGMPMAMVLAGVVVAHSYAPLFFIDSGTCALFALIIAAFLRPAGRLVPHPEDPAPPAGARHAARARSPLADPQLAFVTVASFVLFTVLLQSVVTLPLATKASGLSTASYGLLIAANGIVLAIAQPLAARWLGARDPIRVLAISYAVAGLGMAATGLPSTFAGFGAVVVAWSLGEVALSAVGPALVSRLASAGTCGRYMGVYGTALGASFVAAPVTGTWLYELGPSMLWICCAAVGVAFALAQLAARARFLRRLDVPGPVSPANR
jgi:MFS family permease